MALLDQLWCSVIFPCLLLRHAGLQLPSHELLWGDRGAGLWQVPSWGGTLLSLEWKPGGFAHIPGSSKDATVLTSACTSTNHRAVSCTSSAVAGFVPQAHGGIKGIVKDEDGNGIKGAHVWVRGIRHNITSGKSAASTVFTGPFFLSFHSCFLLILLR